MWILETSTLNFITQTCFNSKMKTKTEKVPQMYQSEINPLNAMNVYSWINATPERHDRIIRSFGLYNALLLTTPLAASP